MKKNNYYFTDFTDNYIIYKIFVLIIIIYIVLTLIFCYSTYFTKTIQIKSINYMKNTNNHGLNIIADTDNNIYTVHNSLYYGFFTASELYSNFTVGQSYKIKGYGLRVPILGMYPNVYSAMNINS